jgi:hypothetical protein
MNQTGSTRLSNAFTGSALQDAERDLASGIAQLGADPTFRVLDGGADNLNVRSTPVSSHSISMVGTVTTWSSMAQIQKHGKVVPARPSNILDIKVTMSKIGAVWKVGSFTWTFHPGSAP